MYGRRYRNTKNGKKKDQNEKQAKLDSMSSMLSTCQINCLVITISIFLAAAMVLTAFTSDMLIYDEGNVYSCPVDHLNEVLANNHAEDDLSFASTSEKQTWEAANQVSEALWWIK